MFMQIKRLNQCLNQWARKQGVRKQRTGRAVAGVPGLVTGAIIMGAPLVASLVASGPALALENWQFDTTTQQLVISLPKGVTPRYYLMAEPARIVLDLPNAEVGAVQQSYSGAVRQIRVAQFQPDLARIVLELSPQAVLAPGQVELQPIQDANATSATTQRWTLRPLLANAAPVSPVTPPTSSPDPVGVTPENPAGETAPAALPEAGREIATANPLPPLEPGAVEIPVESAPAQSSVPTSPPTPVQTAAAPTAIRSGAQAVPPVIEFSQPLPKLPDPLAAAANPDNSELTAELTEATGTAATLSTSARSVAAPSQSSTPVGPSTSSLSFPTPTANAVSVPSLSTVNPASAPPDNLASASPISAPSALVPSTVVPFGQPMPDSAALVARSDDTEPNPDDSSSSEPEPAPADRSADRSTNRSSNRLDRRANRPVPAQPAQPEPAQSQPEQPAQTQTTQPSPQPGQSPIQVIPFGQPLPR